MNDLEKYTAYNCEINLAGVKWTNTKSKKQYNFFIKNDEDIEYPELWIKNTEDNGIMTRYALEAVGSSCFITFENVRHKVLLTLNKVKPFVMKLETPSGQIEYFELTV
ncbi:MAG: hypothetical protein H7263_03940 [Candidatus Sericytochromatia bacterium]|nr:hypothetical protein [Candidatus Sericytochromatia bacterium]